MRLFGRFCCVNVLFYVICHELFYVFIFVSFFPNIYRVLYVLVCACVSVVFSVCVYMCMLTMCVCLVGFVVLMCCFMWSVVSYFMFFFVSFLPNLYRVLYVLVCAYVSVLFSVCVYMWILTMWVCFVGFVVLTCCSMWFVMSYFMFLFFVSIFPNLHGVLYVLVCACVSVVFSVCVYMCLLTMCVCFVGFVVSTCCSMLFVMRYFMFLFRQFSPKSSRCSVCSRVFMCVCNFLCMRVHVYDNNVRLFCRFFCVNLLFYVI